MTDMIIEKFRHFRNSLFALFTYRADSTMDLIDAIAGQTSKESTVKLSLSHLFRRTFSSITDAVDNVFRRKANQNPQPEELKDERLKITKLFAEQCPKPLSRAFALFAIDCSSTPRIYSDKLEDRSIVHAPTKVFGQKPITVGHQYSTLVYLPERLEASDSHWVIPLSTERVTTEGSGTLIGMEQITQLLTETDFENLLCVLVDDSAYSNAKCTSKTIKLRNLVHISRIRNNRVFYTPLSATDAPKGRGRPKIYGARWTLNNPGEANESICIERYTKTGTLYLLKIEKWTDRLSKGDDDPPQNETEDKQTKESFDAVRVTIYRENGEPLYKKPLWLMVTGNRRQEISLKDIAESYLQRFDIEHFFRFAKQKLLLTAFQTPDVRHEENWWWLSMTSYMMLYQSRLLAMHTRNPWEKKRDERGIKKILSPSQVQRDYERIIGEIGTPACIPKPRGKSPGRSAGAQVVKRKNYPIIIKRNLELEDLMMAAA